MASSSQDPFDSFDAAVDDAFDDLFEQAFENISIHVDQEEQKKREKNELISKDIVKKGTFIYGMIISVKLQLIRIISSDDVLE